MIQAHGKGLGIHLLSGHLLLPITRSLKEADHAETEEALAPSGSLQLITSPHLSAEGSVSGGSQRSEVVGVLTLQGPRTCDVGRQHLFPVLPCYF